MACILPNSGLFLKTYSFFWGGGFPYKSDQIIDYLETLRSFKIYPILNRNNNWLRPLTSQCKNHRVLLLVYRTAIRALLRAWEIFNKFVYCLVMIESFSKFLRRSCKESDSS